MFPKLFGYAKLYNFRFCAHHSMKNKTFVASTIITNVTKQILPTGYFYCQNGLQKKKAKKKKNTKQNRLNTVVLVARESKKNRSERTKNMDKERKKLKQHCNDLKRNDIRSWLYKIQSIAHINIYNSYILISACFFYVHSFKSRYQIYTYIEHSYIATLIYVFMFCFFLFF